MHQPELGLKVTELRAQKGLTQEQLAEHCEVSARTIQRIESGDVDPRAYTLNCLSNILEFDFLEQDTRSESLWLAALHLSSIFCIPPIPLLLWSWKKKQSSKIDQQGRAALNFQITMMMMLFMGLFYLMLAPVGLILFSEWVTEQGQLVGILTLLLPLPLIAIGVFCTYQGAINTIRSLSDKPIRYPLSIPFVK
jgi:uncharacterized Tic20 family protein/DNA-binding Xre family transcriptional regulator